MSAAWARHGMCESAFRRQVMWATLLTCTTTAGNGTPDNCPIAVSFICSYFFNCSLH